MPPAPKGHRLGHTKGTPAQFAVSDRDKLIIPGANEKWHPVARSWYNSLKVSGQTKLWEASDWTTAVVAATALDRFLRTNNASIFQNFVRLSERLAVTESDRRRAHIELTDPDSSDKDEEAAEAAVNSWQRRLRAVD